MKIKFEPKVIIGTVFGIISTIVGTIAIFFPNLLNLEVRQIDKLECYIEEKDWISTEKLLNFIFSKSGKKDEVFYLKIDAFGPFLDSWLERPITHQENKRCKKEIFIFEPVDVDNSAKVRWFHISNDSFNFREDETTHETKIIFDGLMFDDDIAGRKEFTIEAYFIFEETYVNQNTRFILFRKVPDEMVRSKKY